MCNDQFLHDVDNCQYSDEELRQAAFSLRGELLRMEQYETETLLMDIEQTGHSIRLLQPCGPNQKAAFHSFRYETYTAQFERSLGDPMISQELNLEVDHFSNALRSVRAYHGRKSTDSSLQKQDQTLQQDRKIFYTLATFTKPILDKNLDYLAPRPISASEFEVSGMETIDRFFILRFCWER